jgi:hypothetical protein
MKAVRSPMIYAMPLIAVCLSPLLTPCSMFGQAFPPIGPAFVSYSASGSDATAIAPVVDAFRNVLGTNNGNARGSQPNGRREINWDGGGDAANFALFATPMKTFNTAPTTRGAVFTTVSGFEISGQQMPRFGEINISYPGIFTTFSAPRLFTPLGSTITDVLFTVPGEENPAVVSGFGAVFTDVDLPQSTFIEYFDTPGNSLGRAFVPPANNGLSFVGIVFQGKRIARVRITSGNASLSATTTDGAFVDVVAMDDFIYGEPSVDPIPPPPNPFNPPSNQPPPNPFNPLDHPSDPTSFGGSSGGHG